MGKNVALEVEILARPDLCDREKGLFVAEEGRSKVIFVTAVNAQRLKD